MNRSIALMLVSTGMAILVSNTNIVAARAQVAVNPNPVRGYYARGPFETVVITGVSKEIQHISLPKGKYIVNASANFISDTARAAIVQCWFTIDGFIIGEPATGQFIGTGMNPQHLSLSLTTGLRLLGSKVLALNCGSDEPTDSTAFVQSMPSPITAVRVDVLRVD